MHIFCVLLYYKTIAMLTFFQKKTKKNNLIGNFPLLFVGIHELDFNE